MLPIFAEFRKIDADQRMVFGYATTEARDQQGEIVRRGAVEDALPGYMKFANIREMHQPSAVGTAKEAEMDGKGLWLGAHVVDDAAWNKVKAGVYKGFSIGGKVLSRDPGDKSIITGLELTEISLVDRPANPEATYTVVKRVDGKLMAQPLQKWDCGVSVHQHSSKSEASACMEKRLELEKGAEPDNRTNAQKAKEHEEWAAYHSHQAKTTGSDAHLAAAGAHAAAAAAHRDAKNGFEEKMADMVSEHAHSMTSKAEPETDSTTKRAPPHLDSGKFTTSAGAAEEASKHASEHEAKAATARKMEAKHQGRAKKARDKGDAEGFKLHDNLAGAAAALAETHERAAAHYKALAAHHQSASTMKSSKENDMTRTVAEAEKDAAEALAKLANSTTETVAKVEVMHTDEAREARESAMDHMKEGLSNEVHADEARAESRTALNEGKTEDAVASQAEADQHDITAFHQHDLADGFHELHAHHSEMAAKMAGEDFDHESHAQMAKAVAGEHAENAAHMDMRAQHHDGLAAHHGQEAAKSQGFDHKAAADHHTDMAKRARASVAKRQALQKRMSDLHKACMDKCMAAKAVTKLADLTKSDDGWFSKVGDFFGKREFSDKKRQELADKGHALPDGSFPIENKSDLENAVQAYGRAKNKAKAKSHIVARAKALGATDKLPADWEGSTKEEKAAKSMHEMKMKVCPSCGTKCAAESPNCSQCGASMAKADWAPGDGTDETVSEEERARTMAEKKKKEEEDEEKRAEKVKKGMFLIAELAHLLQSIEAMQDNSAVEQVLEDDEDSDVPDKLHQWLSDGAALLRDIVAEETEELVGDEDVEAQVVDANPSVIEAAAKAAEPWPATVARCMRLAAKDVKKVAADRRAKVKTLADAFAKASSTLHKQAEEAAAKAVKPVKGANDEQAVKTIDRLTAAINGTAKDQASMRKQIAEQNKTIQNLTAELTKLKNEPLPPKGKGIVTGNSIKKADDLGGSDVQPVGTDGKPLSPILEKVLAAEPGAERAKVLDQIGYMPRFK